VSGIVLFLSFGWWWIICRRWQKIKLW